ncbi:MAG: glycine betaine/proline transport system permease protein [Rhodospirillaceae bacterium]|jgi:glycine betaine/proline transport system permease protein|nr:glycine betaine/proline transport system permease protein [Rhodospirillaceae bacterium]
MTTVDLGRALPRARGLDPGLATWLAALAFIAACFVLRDRMPWIAGYPSAWVLPIADWINVFTDWFNNLFQPFFRAISFALDRPMRGVQAILQWLPWPSVMLLVGALALRAGGWRLALFAIAALTYLVIVGYWRQSMNTLALVLLAVPLSLVAGFILGVLAYRVPRAIAAIEALLDIMQTMPAFAYLIPLLLLFGFGPVVGLIASAIYAIPPMVRNTLLGLQQVPSDIKESGVMSGCSRRQGFWNVEVPTAMPQILVGVNQTTMAVLSVVIIASIIGGFEDIGWEVLSSMRKAEFGQSLLSGLVIALLAMLIDRITIGFARNSARHRGSAARWFQGRVFFGTLMAGLALAILLRLFAPGGGDLLPSGRGLIDAGILNRWVLALVRDYAGPIEAFKNTVLYFFMLPLRIGMIGAVTPFSWGFALTPAVIAGYVAALLLLAGLLGARFGWRPAVAVIVAGIFFFYGFVAFPWPAFMALVGLLAWRMAGWRITVFALLGLAFMLVTGLWIPLMQSTYLCGLAVLLCLVIGGALGLWAAHNDRVSATLRPINDTLQTMPQFVFLIPALMLFKVGEFTALIAIMLYAIVPPIRYVEHGIRNVRPDIVEAARQMGCTRHQLLWQVKLPLALPVVVLGLNQTIMAALSMLAIAAMVGTRELGQQVYIALGKADPGLGLIAGLSIALLAMISDRMLRAWCGRHQIVATAK